jgi:hypothetical protein
LILAFGGKPRYKNDEVNNQAYDILKQAFDATATWADKLQKLHFPAGYWKILRRPTFQSNNFKRYTWAQIYPTRDSPKELAYTVGIDAVGEFCVKIDTVHVEGHLRKQYERIRGPSYHTSAFASVMAPASGLVMTLEQLVEWSAEQIARFEISYFQLASKLSLISPSLELVEDPELTKVGFDRWRGHLNEGSKSHGTIRWLPNEGFFYRQHSSKGGNVGVEIGLDPSGKTWAVQINEPLVAGDVNRPSAIAVDQTGARYLLRQGRLQINSRRAVPINGDDFARMTGLQPVTVDGVPGEKRDWYMVAALDEPAHAVRRSTALFVERCWSVCVPDGVEMRPPFPFTPNSSKAETGGSYSIPAKSALDEKLVFRRHGEVWLALTSILSAQNIDYWKGTVSGFEIDLEIKNYTNPLLIEIKTSVAISDIYSALGQLQLYRRIFPNLSNHQPVLLLPEGMRADLQEAIEACGVFVHTYCFEESESSFSVNFSSELQELCGLA